MDFYKIYRSFFLNNSFLNNVFLVYFHQILQILVAIISVPIALSYFGNEKYGIIAIIWTLITYLGLINFGLPIALRVFLSVNQKKVDRQKTFLMVFRLLIFLSCVFLALLFFIPDNLLLIIIKVPEELSTLASSTIFISFFLYFLSIPFLAYIEGFAGIGMIGRVKLYEILNIILAFFCLLLVVNQNLSIFDFFLFRGILTFCISLIATLDLYLRINKYDSQIFNNNKDEYHERFELKWKKIINTAFFQFMTGISAILIWHTDNLIISHFFGLEEVTKYSLTFRLMTTSFILFTSITTVLSPVYGLNFGNHKYKKTNIQYNRALIFIPLVAGLAWIGAINFAPELLNLWVGKDGDAGLNVILVLGAYGFCLSFIHSHLALISAINLMKYIPALGLLEALINLVFSILLVNYYGLVGVALGTLIGGIFCAAILPILIWKTSEIRFHFNWKHSIFQFFIIILPLILLSLALRSLELNYLIQIKLSFIIIIIFFYLVLKLIPKKEINWLKKLLKRRFKIKILNYL